MRAVTPSSDPAVRAEVPRQRVWDLPVRVFHWLLVAAVATSVGTGLTGGNAMVWHERSGVLVLCLVLARLVWGGIGSATARFAAFLAGPRRLWAYRREFFSHAPDHGLGHNPWAGWMVVVLLAVLLAQAGTGLFANDDIATEGPLAWLVRKSQSDALTGWHQRNAVLLGVLVAGHLAAVAWHRWWKREDVVGQMISGWKRAAGSPVATEERSPWLALGVFVVIASAVAWVLATWQDGGST